MSKVVHVIGTDRRVQCCWTGPGGDSCQQDGRESHKLIVPDGPDTITYIFCTERHLDYFKYSHLSFGNLPPGSRNRIT